MESQLTQATEPEKLTLTKFINENEKILAVIGVFIALSAFLTTLPLKTLTTFLSFLCLVATIPLFFELYKKLFKPQKTMNLIVFTNIFSLICGYFVWYVLIAFREQWKTELPKVIFWAVFLPLFILYRRYLAQKLVNLVAYLLLRTFRLIDFLPWNSLEKRIKNFFIEFSRNLKKENLSKIEKIKRRKEEKLRLQKILFDSRQGLLIMQEEHSNEIKNSEFASFIFSALIFCILFLTVDYLSKPVANYLNEYFDKQSEWYRQEEQKINVPSPTPSVTTDSNVSVPSPIPTTTPEVNANVPSATTDTNVNLPLPTTTIPPDSNTNADSNVNVN